MAEALFWELGLVKTVKWNKVFHLFKLNSQKPADSSPIETIDSESNFEEESLISSKCCRYETLDEINETQVDGTLHASVKLTSNSTQAEAAPSGQGNASATHSKQDQAAKIAEEMSRDLQEDKIPQDKTEEITTDWILDQMNCKAECHCQG